MRREPSMHEQELDLLGRAWDEWVDLSPEEIIDQLEDGPLLRFMAQMRYEQINAVAIMGALELRDERDQHARESEWHVR